MRFQTDVFSPSKKFITLSLVFCVCFFIFFFSSHPAIFRLRAFCFDAIHFPMRAVSLLAHEGRAVLFFHRSYWDNLKIRRDNEELRTRLLHLESVASENDRLRGLLDLKKRIDYSLAAAQVIGRDFNTFRPYLIIGKGASGGLKKSAPVLTNAGLVGKIFEVGRYSSQVILINDPGLGVPAMIARTREHGLVRGTLDGRCQLRFLETDTDVREGDIVVTSGLNMTYPPDIPIGRVKVVGIEPSGIGKFAILDPVVRLSSLEEVAVVVGAG